MIKKEIVSWVLNLCPKEDDSGKFHPRVVEAVIEDVLKGMYADFYAINPRLIGSYGKMFGETSPIPILFDQKTNIYYSVLPQKIVNLPCPGSGVLNIFPYINTGNAFLPMTVTQADFIFNTDVAVVSSKVGYTTRQDTRVDFWNSTTAIRAMGVRLLLLIPFSKYLSDDVVEIPPLTEKQGGTFIQRVMNQLGMIQPPDLIDDNKDSAPQSNNQKQ